MRIIKKYQNSGKFQVSPINNEVNNRYVSTANSQLKNAAYSFRQFDYDNPILDIPTNIQGYRDASEIGNSPYWYRSDRNKNYYNPEDIYNYFYNNYGASKDDWHYNNFLSSGMEGDFGNHFIEYMNKQRPEEAKQYYNSAGYQYKLIKDNWNKQHPNTRFIGYSGSQPEYNANSDIIYYDPNNVSGVQDLKNLLNSLQK